MRTISLFSDPKRSPNKRTYPEREVPEGLRPVDEVHLWPGRFERKLSRWPQVRCESRKTNPRQPCPVSSSRWRGPLFIRWRGPPGSEKGDDLSLGR